MIIRMFCGEYDGELQPSHLHFTARDARHELGEMFRFDDGYDRSEREAWYKARKEGWRVVKVKIEKIK